jgi:hypothetical protein
MEEHGFHAAPASRVENVYPAGRIKRIAYAGFTFKEFRGTSPDVSIPKMTSLLRKRAKGEIGYKALGQRFKLVESNDLKILYMGYAVKPMQ